MFRTLVFLLLKVPIIKRLIPSLYRRLNIFKVKYKTIKLGNLFFYLNILNPVDRQIYMTGRYEEDSYALIKKIIKRHKINYFFDIGACWGYYSLRIASEFNKINIDAFEPIKSTLPQFTENLKINNFSDRVKIHNVALSDTTKILRMDTQYKHNNYQTAGYHVSKDGKFQVNAEKLDNIIKIPNEKIAIKIDTENHEFHVLKGMENILRNNECFLMIEIDQKFVNFKEISRYLLDMGYNPMCNFDLNYFFVKRKYLQQKLS